MTIASKAVKKAVSQLIEPVSERQTAREARTGATATPKVFGRMASNQAPMERGATSVGFVIKVQP